MTQDQFIAETIYRQMGGREFSFMTNARHFELIEKGLSFTIGQNPSKANKVQITLKDDDTYLMQFIRKGTYKNFFEDKVLREYDGIYFHQLRSSFTEFTKMQTSLF